MELIRGLHNLVAQQRKNPDRRYVVTTGNFDGVHCGHQMILRQLKQKADELGLPTRVLIFEPQPMEFFAGSGAPARLTPFHEKVALILGNSIDSVVCLHFNEALRNMPANQFIEQILVNSLGVQALIVGDDFRFGYKQSGDFELLREAGVRHGFSVSKNDTLVWDNHRVSSTRIRVALEDGDFSLAEQLLGRPYSMSGRVMYGRQIGRTIGIPTANLSLKGKKAPLQGVYAVQVAGLERFGGIKLWQGVANVGLRPTVDGEQPMLESHIFDFDHAIYGERIRVIFRHKIRDERKFDNVELLKQQILLDIEAAKKHFGLI
ncbi:MAG: bifunctional riboflavin kinase/FAD synthetase [Pseudomonadales bacterium]|nr:bifunctional riboflavin kinase/FAD synthetase [Pseudomonadales bacterium]MCP5213587.1 bifunctional riboflavin kinase/FAD synthetase [Pseudomonadales bacterium]